MWLVFHQVIISHKHISGYACVHVYIRGFDFLMKFRPTASDGGVRGVVVTTPVVNQQTAF